MSTLILVELAKLRTVRAPRLLLAVSQLVIIAGVGGAAMSSDDLRNPETVSKALAHAGLVSLITLMLGIMAVAGEYRNRTITDTYLSTPRRGRVIQAKLAAYATAGAAFGLANAVTALVATYVWWTAEGVSVDVTTPAVWHTVAGGLAANIVFTVIGVGVGALIRNLAVAVAVALIWIALVEGIIGQLIGDAARWLPFAGGSALSDLPVAGGTVPALPQAGGGLVLAGYAVAFAVVAVSTTVRRDVS